MRGVETRFIESLLERLLVVVIAVAGLGALALVSGGLVVRICRSVFPIHEDQPIKAVDISPIDSCDKSHWKIQCRELRPPRVLSSRSGSVFEQVEERGHDAFRLARVPATVGHDRV